MTHSDLLSDLVYKNYASDSYNISNPYLDAKLNGLNKGDYLLITGLPGSGKRSFVDNYFLMDMLRKWNKKTEEEKEAEPLKILYFSTKYKMNYKYMKWGCLAHFNSTGIIMDIPTLTNSSGRLYNLEEEEFDKYLEGSELIGKAIKDEVLTFIDTNVSNLTLDKTLNDLAEDMGDIEYDEAEVSIKYHDGYENTTVIVIVDDINHIKAGMSSYGEGYAKKAEILDTVNTILKKYASLGFAIVAINTSEYAKFKAKYIPSTSEITGFSVNKCIIMYNPFQEKMPKHLGFDTLEFVDVYGVNRLRFAYIAYNEVGVSNHHIPLLFIPENGKFVPMELDEEKMDINIARFNNIVKTRRNKQ